MIYGLDCSYANGNPAWQTALSDARVQFVYARASYGTNPADDDGPAFTNAHNACKARGTKFGSYFFWLMGQDGAAQAKHFLEAANGMFGDLSVMVDVEEGSGVQGWGPDVASRIANLSATLTALQAKVGQPIIYVNADTWGTYFGNTDAFAGHRFVIAQYGVAPGKFDPVPGIEKVVMHQYSDGQGQPPIAGLSTPGNNVDRDVILTDFSSLAR
jgi:GH25 family lysozyme M1 (1,4-beta-N-acetylmuramidase)